MALRSRIDRSRNASGTIVEVKWESSGIFPISSLSPSSSSSYIPFNAYSITVAVSRCRIESDSTRFQCIPHPRDIRSLGTCYPETCSVYDTVGPFAKVADLALSASASHTDKKELQNLPKKTKIGSDGFLILVRHQFHLLFLIIAYIAIH